MMARFVGWSMAPLIFVACAGAAEAIPEQERAERVLNVVARCELILSGQDPDLDEGRRLTEDLLARLEREVGDPPQVWRDVRARNPGCLALLNRPTLQVDGGPEKTASATSLRAPADTSVATIDQPTAPAQAHAAGPPAVALDAPVQKAPTAPSPAAVAERPAASSAAPIEPAAASPLVAASAEPPAVPGPPRPPAPPLSDAAPPPPVAKPARGAPLKPAQPRPAATLTVLNGRDVPATNVTVRTAAKTVEHAQPLASQAKAVLKLPKLKGCVVTVSATFQGGDASEVGDIDLCKVKLVRLTD